MLSYKSFGEGGVVPPDRRDAANKVGIFLAKGMYSGDLIL